MKICLITEYFYPEDSGGTPTVLSQLMRYMKDHYDDLEIDVVTSNNLYRKAGGKLSAFEDWDNIKISRVNSPRSNQFSIRLRLLAGCVFALQALLKLFFARKYDLIFLGSNPPVAPMVGRWIWNLYGIPYCYLVHDLYPDIAIGLGALDRKSKVARIAKTHQRRWLHDARAVIVLGRCMKEYLRREYQLPNECIEVITSWCDPNEIIPASKATNFRIKHSLTGFLVIYAGNMGRSQGLDTVLDAAKLLQESYPEIQFVLVGEGDVVEILSARKIEDKLNNVHILPAVSKAEYPEVLASSDVSLVSLDHSLEGLAVPSKSYNILSSGRPLIALMSNNCEISYMIAEHHCGVQVDPGDAEQLAEIIASLSTNPAQVMTMGSNARTALEKYYCIEHVSVLYWNLFHDISNKKC